jgi:hypothetical protein
MKVRSLLALILFGLRCGASTAADFPPPDLAALQLPVVSEHMNRVAKAGCAAGLLSILGSKALVASTMIQGVVSTQLTRLGTNHLDASSLEALAQRYFQQEIAKERPAYLVVTEIERLLRARLTPHSTADEIERSFGRLASEMAFLREEGRSVRQLNWEGLALQSSDPYVQKVLSAFPKTGTLVFSMDLEPYVATTALLTGDYVERVNGEAWIPEAQTVAQQIRGFVTQKCVFEGCYHGNVGPSGVIVLPAHLNLVDPRSKIVHEISHAVQDRFWDLGILAKAVEGLSEVPDFAEFQDNGISLFKKKARLLTDTRFPDYRQAIFGAEKEPAEWMVLSDLLVFLFELDADDVSGRFNSDEGRTIEERYRTSLYEYELEKSVAVGEIHPLSARLMKKEWVEGLLVKLRANYR